MIAFHEREQLAERLIDETCRKEGVGPQQLTLHSDRGSPMRAKPFKALLEELEITSSHSRPYTPTDNPYSEAQFRTMKSRPSYPERFDDIGEAQQWVRGFVAWYNQAHYHTSLGLLTPASVHHGKAEQIVEERQRTLDGAYAAHPERFVAERPTAAAPPEAVWINQPEERTTPPASFSGAVTSASKPGTQAASMASGATLDAGEHLATIGCSLPRQCTKTDMSLLQLERELSQSHCHIPRIG